ncbi:hypothetical protein [Cytobacillus sp. NCCP-133]|uniref:hypothetical protein n=1 Tax=Cytobacillus sp. NCCP-133 TaxID=766848 RepID=UPI00222F60E9|nr:hypothetical protein [Cytobacillus sp. NCCP-133]GLB58653.1 hypothetical protein NCCP133_07860 [Cytobacillus sp. NCCP-133]
MIKGKDKQLDYVKTFHDQYVIIIAKHPRFNWVKHTENKDMYFIYITRLEKHFVDKKTAQIGEFNVLCYHNVFFNYHDMMLRLEPILSEYILDSKKIFKIAMLAQELEYHSEDPLKQASGE